ncbi:MAG: hypothetical protein HYX36_15980 [Rhizobiales bacterium]|nr:hypothetical protein [Hyphomicrobiales bacterium]
MRLLATFALTMIFLSAGGFVRPSYNLTPAGLSAAANITIIGKNQTDPIVGQTALLPGPA